MPIVNKLTIKFLFKFILGPTNTATAHATANPLKKWKETFFVPYLICSLRAQEVLYQVFHDIITHYEC